MFEEESSEPHNKAGEHECPNGTNKSDPKGQTSLSKQDTQDCPKGAGNNIKNNIKNKNKEIKDVFFELYPNIIAPKNIDKKIDELISS